MRILGVGHCTLDYIGIVDRFAEPDFKKELMQFSTQGGGSAATALVALSRWGIETTFIGKTGDDSRGSEIVRTLAEEGVDTRFMIQQPGAVSQLSFIVAETASGKKQTYVTEGNVTELEPGDFDVDAVLEGIDVLLADGTHVPAELSLMRAARERGITVVLDAAAVREGIADAVACCDYLVASERFASQFAGVGQLESLCHALLKRGPSTVCVTLGNEGAVAMSRGSEMLRRDAFDVEVIDPTGAGDIFHGAFIYGVANEWDLAKNLDFATVAAGLSCRGIGGRSAIPSVAEVLGKI